MAKNNKFEFVITKNYEKERRYIILKPFKGSIIDNVIGMFVKR